MTGPAEPSGRSLRIVTDWPQPDVCLVRLAGELDSSTAAHTLDHLCTQTAGRPTSLVLDLTAIELLAAAGVSLLIVAMRNEHDVHGRLHVVAPAGGAARRTLRLTGTDAVLRVHGSVAAALAAADTVRRN